MIRGAQKRETLRIALLCLLSLLVFSSQRLAFLAEAAPYIPHPNSPLGKSQHPRLHITLETLPYFRGKITTYYSIEYQKFVTWLDENFDSNPVNKAGVMSDYYALVFVLDSLPGINYQRSISDYGQHAIEIMMGYVDQPPATSAKSYSYLEDHFAKISRTYDWMWDQLSFDQRRRITNWLADAGITILHGHSKGIDHGEITGLWSSHYFESWFPWYYGLAIYGDGFRDEDAQILIDSFEQLNLHGKWLDAHNWVARDQGGVSEIGTYGLWHPLNHIVQIDGWRTATGEDYFAQRTELTEAYFVQYYPQYLLYRTKPFGKVNPAEPGGIEWKPIKAGEMTTDTTLDKADRVLSALGEPLRSINEDMASLNRWLLENRTGDDLHYPWLYFINFLWGDRSIPAHSPQELGLPLSQYFAGMGMAIMRTGFESLDDTAILVFAPEYQLAGHSWFGPIPNGFIIDKYGPLAFKRQSYLRGGDQRENTMRFTDPLLEADGGYRRAMNGPKTVQEYTPESKWYLGGMQHVLFDGNLNYLSMDYTRYYSTERVKSYTRQFVYFRPESNAESDTIIIFDRTETTRPDIIKRWEICSAYRPQINGIESQVREGKWEYENSDMIIISNNVDPDPYSGIQYGGHGRLFVRTLWPDESKTVTFGGPEHEFENDAGVAHGYKNEETDYHYLNKVGAFYTGTYCTDVVALSERNQENFLHVLQIADASVVDQMVPVQKVDAGTWVGAHIQDDLQGYKVVLFSRTEELQNSASYSVTSSQPIQHLIADLEPGLYRIDHNGQELASSPLLTSEANTLLFTTQSGGAVTISKAPPRMGDLNLDGIVNNDDVHLCARVILGRVPQIEIIQRADLNSDGMIDAIDLQKIINLMAKE